MDLGRAMRQLREALGMTQEDLAVQMNASRSFIAQVETGRMALPADRFPELAEAVMSRLGQIGRLRPDPAVVIALRILVSDQAKEHAFDQELRGLVVLRETARIIGQMTEDVVRVALTGRETTLPYIVGPLIGLTLAFPDEEVGTLVAALAPPTAEESPADAAARTFQNVQTVFAMAAADHFIGGLGENPPKLSMLARHALTDRSDETLKRLALREVRAYASAHDLGMVRDFIDALTTKKDQGEV